MDLRNEMVERFTRRLLATPEGRAHVLNQIADAESNGENQVFEHVLEHVVEPSLRKMIQKHQTDELRHERLFRACVQRNGVTPGPVPSHLRLIDRIDRAVGGFFAKELDPQTGVMEAYLMLQVIEERAVTQFKIFEKLFREIDPVIADTFVEVAADEERHLKYCHAISRRYAPDEATRVATLARYREVEARCFQENSQANMDYVFSRGYFAGGPVVQWMWRTLAGLGERRGELPFTRFAHDDRGALAAQAA
jgi:rubrerythrin